MIVKIISYSKIIDDFINEIKNDFSNGNLFLFPSLDEIYSNNRRITFAYIDNNAIIGMISIITDEVTETSQYLQNLYKSKVIHLDYIVVKKEYQRKKIGTQLMNEIENYIYSSITKSIIYSTVSPINSQSLQFHFSNKFKAIKYIENYYGFPRILMVKKYEKSL